MLAVARQKLRPLTIIASPAPLHSGNAEFLALSDAAKRENIQTGDAIEMLGICFFTLPTVYTEGSCVEGEKGVTNVEIFRAYV